ncbi:LapA family protein [Nocardia sp. NBC_00416]|uniref:LapA family protein n=1 Tax=Nocardia sp. NBC_00416 TaxID=2975991 RepID=UPI002E24B0BD
MTERAPKPSLLSRVSLNQWLALALTIVAVVFIIQNRDRVNIHFLLITVGSPMWLILLIMFVAGLLAGWLTGRRARR